MKLLQVIEQSPNASVESLHHSFVDLARSVYGACHFLIASALPMLGALERIMGSTEGNVEEEGLLVMGIQKGETLIDDKVREIPVVMDLCLAPPKVVIAESVGVFEVVDIAGDEAHKLIETVPRRKRFFRISKMPLTKDARRVSNFAEEFRQQHEARPNSKLPFVDVEDAVVACALLILTRQEGNPGWRADGRVSISVREPEPACRQLVDIGRRDVRRSRNAKVPVAEIVSDDEYNIGLCLGLLISTRATRQKDPCQRP